MSSFSLRFFLARREGFSYNKKGQKSDIFVGIDFVCKDK